VFLILRLGVRFINEIAATRTGRGTRNVMLLVHNRGNGSVAAATISEARLAAWSPRATSGRGFRGWGGQLSCCSASRPALASQARLPAWCFRAPWRASSLDASMFAFGPLEFLTQPRIVPPKFFDGIRRCLLRAPAHAAVYARIPVSVQVRRGNQIPQILHTAR